MLIAGVLGGGVVLIVIIAVALSGGGDGGTPAGQQTTPAPAPTTAGPPFSPVTDDEKAVQELARRSIETLPEGQWPSLYDSFTPEFRQRCPQEQFNEGGVKAEQDLGADLALLSFKRLEQVTVTETTASAVIVGEVRGKSEYTVQAGFAKADGVWKIAPAPNTQGCEAFSRLSG
ncbi:MAG: hypothetical protein Q7T33_01060 [Dehalococcoidia bacterium]|nr:hypothetical protein [Dehalococcoidia bacterium]